MMECASAAIAGETAREIPPGAAATASRSPAIAASAAHPQPHGLLMAPRPRPPPLPPMYSTTSSTPTSRLRREAVVRAALLRWLQHHPTPAPEPIYLLVTLKRTPVRRFEHCLRLPRSPFPFISLVSDRLPADLPNDIEPLPHSALCSLPAAARRGLVLVDRRLRVPNGGKAAKDRGRVVPVDLADPEWAESAREAARCVELRVEAGTCRAVRVGHAAMTQEAAVENVLAAAEAAASCVPRKWRNVRALHVKAPESIALPLYSAPGTGDDDGNVYAEDAKREGAAVEQQGRAKRRKE